MPAPLAAVVARGAQAPRQAGQTTPRARQVAGRAREAADTISQQAQVLSGQVLRWAWLTVIPSYGLTLLYINLHFLGRYFANSRWFCHFGQEWMVKGPQTAGGPFGFSNPRFTGLEYGELILLFLVDVLVVVLLTIVGLTVSMAVWASTHPCEFVKAIGYPIAATLASLGGPFAPLLVSGCLVVNAAS